MLFFVTYLLLLLVPGWLVCVLTGVRRNRLLLSIAVSAALVPVNLAAVRAVTLPASTAAALTLIEVAVMLGLAGALRVSLLRSFGPAGGASSIFVPAALLGAIGVYSWIAGPYLEVPGDPWWHVAKIEHLLLTGLGGEARAGWRSVLDEPNLYGYFTPALVAWVWNYAVADILGWLNLANTLLFCAAVYAFAWTLFGYTSLDQRWRHLAAVMAVLFTIMHFGINVFSFVRYYVFAPALLSYVLYLAVIALVIDFLNHGSWRWGLPLSLLLCLAVYLLHKQEFLFIVVMASMLVAVEYYYARRPRKAGDAPPPPSGVPLSLLFYAMVLFWCVLWIYSYLNLSRSNPLAYGTIIPLDNILPFFKNLFVLDPTFQFYEVVGVWGSLVFALFAVHLSRAKERLPSFLVAGMLVPFATVFNPFFVDLFLRHNYPDVMWRICYIIPLPFVGGYFFVAAARGLLRAGIGAKLRSGAAAALLLVLLLPISTTFFENRFSRLYTVAPSPPDVTHERWQDLFAFLNTRDRESVITDQVTGYLINALTPHVYPGQKFYGFGAPKVNRRIYQDGAFSKHAGSLVVVNLRDGGSSRVGRISGHWPENILKVSRFYSPGFLGHVRGHPDRYKKIWDQDDIQVYEIQS